MARAVRHAQSDPAEWRRLHCSFCGKDADHVRFLVAGVAGGMICDRCNLQSLGIFLKAHVTALSRRLRNRV
jgi:ClpX C4-type zinc finger protein